MTSASQILSVVTLAVALSGAAARCAEPSFSLSISMPQAVLKADAEVIVKIVLKNTTDHNLRFVADPGAPFVYTATVVDGNGRAAPYTELGNRTWAQGQGPFASSGNPAIDIVEAPRTCVPGNRYSLSNLPRRCQPFCTSADIEVANRDCGLVRHEVVISHFYDLTKPGKYTIQVQRYDEESKTTVKSNAIVVTITP